MVSTKQLNVKTNRSWNRRNLKQTVVWLVLCGWNRSRWMAAGRKKFQRNNRKSKQTEAGTAGTWNEQRNWRRADWVSPRFDFTSRKWLRQANRQSRNCQVTMIKKNLIESFLNQVLSWTLGWCHLRLQVHLRRKIWQVGVWRGSRIWETRSQRALMFRPCYWCKRHFFLVGFICLPWDWI